VNHYATLGVTESATSDEIKQAYRRKAMLHHPDRVEASNKVESEAKFKEVKTAYETLSDPTKRASYDASMKHRKSDDRGRKTDFDFNSHFYDIYKDAAQKARSTRDESSLWEDLYDEFDSSGYAGYETYSVVNKDVTVLHSMSLSEAFHGKDIVVTFMDGRISRSVSMRVPPGIETGNKLRSVGGGSHLYNKVKPGNLLVVINIQAMPGWERKEQHLYHTVDVNVLDLVAGCHVEVNTIDGATLDVQIRAGTSLHSTIRIPGRGMPVRTNPSIRGDMFLVINPIVKAATSVEAKELVAKLKKLIS
jgi:DnaJ-class molecular chaperone